MLEDHADGSATADTTGSSTGSPSEPHDGAAPAVPPEAKRATRKRTAKKATTADGSPPAEDGAEGGGEAPAAKKATKKAATKRSTAKKAAATETTGEAPAPSGGDTPGEDEKPKKKATRKRTAAKAAAPAEGTSEQAVPDQGADRGAGDATRPSVAAVFQAPETTTAPARRRKKATEHAGAADGAAEQTADQATDQATDQAGGSAADEAAQDEGDGGEGPARRKRRRGGRRRRKSGAGDHADGAEASDDGADAGADESGTTAEQADEGESGGGTSSRRRRRRRRAGEDDGDSGDDPANTVTKVRSGRSAADEITAVTGSTRLEAKKQRRREGREAGRRRAPIVSEAEFLARRESVNRVMVIRQHADVTQIGVLEDNVLVEHYVARESQTSLIGNVYLGRVQNVLPSMEAAFIDIGKGRNAVLYAGEVNWSALGHKEGQPRKIESVLSSGQTILVQVTKDPIGHKGARLTSQVSLAGRFLVYVPDGTTSGISRKLPDTERNRLKSLLKEIVPEHAGVIVRTAAEGASESELTRDVERLTGRWDDIEKKAGNGRGSAPQLLYGEPDLTLKVVRDLFTEDFAKLVIEGADAWDTVQGYVAAVAPDLEDRLERYEPKKDQDVFAAYRIDEQIKKGLDRKVWLPSGGSLIIDRTEAMTVVDVNTGKFTGSGGNLEETVTKNNLEAAEEIVRQLRLRDIGGIIVVDFIDMVLESNRDLVLRRLVECLGRDRTRHQVAEVTSLGLVQMTRKRIGTGLLESFSHDCPTCHGRGVVIEDAPVEPKKAEEEPRRTRSRRSRNGRGQEGGAAEPPKPPSPMDVAAMSRHHEERAEERAEEPVEELVEELDQLSEELTAEPVEDLTEDTPVESQVESQLAAVVAEPVGSDVDVVVTAEPSPPPAEPEKPRVVTRTRRRAASRPAGPPASASIEPASESQEPEPAAESVPEDAAEQPADETPALHVPVKRRGARKH